jgi:hypothetical protein
MKKKCEFCGNVIVGFSRSTKKYCNDNCKQLAFYARQGMNWGKNGSAEIISQPQNLLSVKPDFTLSGKQENERKIEQSISEKEVIPQEKADETAISVKLQPKQNYRWVNSRLLEAIEDYRMKSYAEDMFRNPQNYWTQDAITVVHSASVRFRCLLENIIRLSNYKCIDRDTLCETSCAFNDLTDSWYFRYLPSNYPYGSLIIELRDKFKGMAQELQGDEITLRLSLYRKAELMAVRFMIGNFVPKKNFSQLKFGDGIREEVIKEFEQSEREKLNK